MGEQEKPKVKLKLSKKDVIPAITSAIFFAWIVLWLVAILIGWIPLDFFSFFYFILPIPWGILITIVWINWKNINNKILYPEYGKSHFDPLYIKEGLVRLFQIVIVFIVFLYYIMLEISAIITLIPSGLLVVVNAILAYIGFRSSDILPKDYIIESLNSDVPTNRKLLNSLPLVKDAFSQFEIKLKETIDTIEQLVKQGNAKTSVIIQNIEGRLEDIEKIISNMPYRTFTRDQFDKYNYLLLVFILATINIIVQPAFNVPSYIALPTFSIFGILIGVSARNKINGNITNRLLEDIQALKNELNSYVENVKTLSSLTSERLEDLKLLYGAFMQSNFLEFIPANYSPLLSIGFVSFLSLFVFILPLPIPEAIFTTMQWFVIYYFTTKQ